MVGLDFKYTRSENKRIEDMRKGFYRSVVNNWYHYYELSAVDKVIILEDIIADLTSDEN